MSIFVYPTVHVGWCVWHHVHFTRHSFSILYITKFFYILDAYIVLLLDVLFWLFLKKYCWSFAVSIKLFSNQKVQSMRLTKLHRFALIYTLECLVCYKDFGWIFKFVCWKPTVYCNQLRIIIKPKQCIGVGPLCNPQQVTTYHGQRYGCFSPLFYPVYQKTFLSCVFCRFAIMFWGWSMESGPLFLDLYVCYFLLYLRVESVSFKRHKFSLTGVEYLGAF